MVFDGESRAEYMDNDTVYRNHPMTVGLVQVTRMPMRSIENSSSYPMDLSLFYDHCIKDLLELLLTGLLLCIFRSSSKTASLQALALASFGYNAGFPAGVV